MIIKEIDNFPGYLISDIGDVYSTNGLWNKNLKKLKPSVDKDGYLYVRLYKEKHQYHKKVHRLVAETFIQNPKKKLTVNHKNGIKNDNRVENLEWTTMSENIQHMYKTLGYKGPWANRFGKDNHKAKIVLQIKNNKIVAYFYGICDAERKTGICNSSISMCCNNKLKTAGGYQWQYKNRK